MLARSIGARIRDCRSRAGLSQKEAASTAGVSLSTLRNWENDRREPLLSSAGRLADALGVSVAAFLDPVRPPVIRHVAPLVVAVQVDGGEEEAEDYHVVPVDD